MPDFEFFEAHSGAMQRKKVEIRGAFSLFAARRKIMNSFLKLLKASSITTCLLTPLSTEAQTQTSSDDRSTQKTTHTKHNQKDEHFFERTVWLVDMSHRLRHFIPDPDTRLSLLKQIHYEAHRINLSPSLIMALIQTESAFDRFAVSSAGAQGLMQVMPFWKKVIGKPQDNLLDVSTNLRYGHTILRRYLVKEKGNLTKALARYNGSRGKTWYPERVYNNWEKHWQ